MTIITREINQYDQDGEYFFSAYVDTPTLEQLTRLFKGDTELAAHVLDGGGRRGIEETWFNLRRVHSGQPFSEL